MDNILITYSGYFLFLLSLALAYFQYRGKKKIEYEKITMECEYDESKTNKHIRYEAYKNYIYKIDYMNQRLLNNLQSEEVLEAAAEMNREVFANPSESANVIQMYFNKFNKFIIDWGNEQYRMSEEFSGVKIVCSEQILELLDRYSIVTKEYVDLTLKYLTSYPLITVISQDSDEIKSMKNCYTQIISIRNQIVNQMRIDIGISKPV
ncbi:MAG: hypothetical protein AB1521_05690 [Bacteroidota bacterium]